MWAKGNRGGWFVPPTCAPSGWVRFGWWRGGSFAAKSLGADQYLVRVVWQSGASLDAGPFEWESGVHRLQHANGGALMSFLTRVVDAAGGGTSPGRLSGVLVDCPAVTEYLTASVYPDGGPRERSVISVFIEDARVKLCLNDRDAGRTLWRSADGIEDCLILVETAIVDGTADWRRAAASRPAGGGRKSK